MFPVDSRETQSRQSSSPIREAVDFLAKPELQFHSLVEDLEPLVLSQCAIKNDLQTTVGTGTVPSPDWIGSVTFCKHLETFITTLQPFSVYLMMET